MTAAPMVEKLLEIYLEVYADADGRFFNKDRYRRQLSGHMTLPGWTIVLARLDVDVVGYSYGFPLPPHTNWWKGLKTPAPDDFTSETGTRTFAISELLVRPKWRRRGYARSLHDSLLAHRVEQRATLLVEKDNPVARHAYLGWGWSLVGELLPSWDDSPLYDVLILPLGADATA